MKEKKEIRHYTVAEKMAEDYKVVGLSLKRNQRR